MPDRLTVEGRCWTFGDHVPTDAIIPTHVLLHGQDHDLIRRHVLASLNPAFPAEVQPGDIICAGRNFGCSSGRAVAPKALRLVGVGAVVAESFARTFYRNAFEVGLPILELPGIAGAVADGDRARVDVEHATFEVVGTAVVRTGMPPPAFLLAMLKAGGLIPFVRANPDGLTGVRA